MLILFSIFLQAADLSKPIDKRIYKGTQPTCHDFNHLTATADSVSLLVGFSAGQVQLIDPIKKETSKLFNEEVSRSLHLDACEHTFISSYLHIHLYPFFLLETLYLNEFNNMFHEIISCKTALLKDVAFFFSPFWSTLQCPLTCLNDKALHSLTELLIL